MPLASNTDAATENDTDRRPTGRMTLEEFSVAHSITAKVWPKPRGVPLWSSDAPIRFAPMSVEDIAHIAASLHQFNATNTWRRQRAHARSRAWMETAEVPLEPESPLAPFQHDFLHFDQRGRHDKI